MFEAIFILAPLDIQTLQQAQSSDKKHKKLEEEVKNHSVVVDKVVDSRRGCPSPQSTPMLSRRKKNLCVFH